MTDRTTDGHYGGARGSGKTATAFQQQAGVPLEAFQTQEAAREWLRELAQIAGPARDAEAIRGDLHTLAAFAGYESSNKCEAELERLARDLGVAPLWESETEEQESRE